MKKTILLSLVLIIFLVLNGCGKKNAPETKTTGEANIEQVEFKCDNMHCKGCEETISTEVKKINGIKEVVADSKTKIVKVSFNKELTNAKDIEKSINGAGYDTQTSKSENKHNCDME